MLGFLGSDDVGYAALKPAGEYKCFGKYPLPGGLPTKNRTFTDWKP
jgi:hypothetical protein